MKEFKMTVNLQVVSYIKANDEEKAKELFYAMLNDTQYNDIDVSNFYEEDIECEEEDGLIIN